VTSHALTIDLEDWHQMIRRRATGVLEPPSRHVVDATLRLLDLLDSIDVKATFFVVGMVAEAYPSLIREVSDRGHEVGSHSHLHRLVHSLLPAEFREEMRGARLRLQDLTGQPVAGFRAPEFSVLRVDHWCFDVLAEVGFIYDSSVFPARARYGIPDAPRTPFEIATRSGTIVEFPIATWALGTRRLAMGGGSYFRLFPGHFLDRAIQRLDREGTPAVLYFHPYEFHEGWLRLEDLSPRAHFHPGYAKYLVLHNLLTGRIWRRARPILRRFEFLRLDDIHRNRIAALSSLAAS
jgi:polysaccharide deacetylase family protein (PEP-CTERM system associated)